MKNLFTFLTFFFLISTFSILAIGVAIEGKDSMFTKLFALGFALSAISFQIFLTISNKNK